MNMMQEMHLFNWYISVSTSFWLPTPALCHHGQPLLSLLRWTSGGTPQAAGSSAGPPHAASAARGLRTWPRGGTEEGGPKRGSKRRPAAEQVKRDAWTLQPAGLELDTAEIIYYYYFQLKQNAVNEKQSVPISKVSNFNVDFFSCM